MPVKLAVLLLLCISGRFNKENTLCCFTAFAAAGGFTPHCHDLPSHRLPHAGAQRGICRHEVPGKDRWEQPEQHSRTCFSPDGNPQVSNAFPQTHPAPQNSASCSSFALQSRGRKIPLPTTPALNGKVPSPMFTAALPKCLLFSCFSLNTCPSCLVWVKHELTGSYVITLPAQHILVLIVMQSIIFTCY